MYIGFDGGIVVAFWECGTGAEKRDKQIGKKHAKRIALCSATEWSLVSARAMALSEFGPCLMSVRSFHIGLDVICINEWKTASSCFSASERIRFFLTLRVRRSEASAMGLQKREF